MEVQQMINESRMAEKDLQLEINRRNREIMAVQEQMEMLNIKREALDSAYRLKMLETQEQ